MNALPSAVQKPHQHIFSMLVIACGALSSLACTYSYFGPTSSSWSTVGTVEVGGAEELAGSRFGGPPPERRPLRSAGDWPLMLSEQWTTTTMDKTEHYAIDMVPVRGTNLLDLRVTGPSPEHSKSLAQWLTHTFA